MWGTSSSRSGQLQEVVPGPQGHSQTPGDPQHHTDCSPVRPESGVLLVNLFNVQMGKLRLRGSRANIWGHITGSVPK